MKAIKRDEREMKDSGIEWLGKIPIEWRTPQVRHYYDIDRGRVIAKTEIESSPLEGYYPVYSSQTKNKGCMGYIDTFDYANEGLTWTTDGANAGTVFYREGYYNCTNVCGILSAKKDNINVKYCCYSIGLSAYNCRREDINGYKIMSNEMAAIHFVCPNSIDEQDVIAHYLDDRCSKIDTIITKAKASIEEYKELKQAVITQAVTLGIKKNRPLKDTNILWIGKTPCDWQVAELKFFASIKSGITLGQKYPAGAKLMEVPYLRVANVQGEYVDLSDVKTIQVLPEEVDKYRLDAGVVLMTEGGDRDKLGRGCVWHGEITPCLHQNHIFALTTKSDKLLPEYFSHVTTSEVARCYFDYTAKKTTNLANTNSSTIMNFRLPIPPLEEQREIVQYLDKRIKTLNDMISEKQSLIEDLEAYKKSLIYEVVTGKRKVVA